MERDGELSESSHTHTIATAFAKGGPGAHQGKEATNELSRCWGDDRIHKPNTAHRAIIIVTVWLVIEPHATIHIF